MGTKDGIPRQCARLNLETAKLHAKANDTLAEAVGEPKDIDKIIEIETMAKDLELKFKDWETSLQAPWSFSTVAWIDHIDGAQLENSHSFHGRVDEYSDISIATAWNMMRANRIMLGADIVRASACLHPDQDYRITPEYASTARISKDLIEDIIASIPTFLGSPFIENNGLNGKSALALFILWPLFVVFISDHTSDEQRKWASGRLRFIAEEVGISQASLFTQVSFAKSK